VGWNPFARTVGSRRLLDGHCKLSQRKRKPFLLDRIFRNFGEDRDGEATENLNDTLEQCPTSVQRNQALQAIEERKKWLSNLSKNINAKAQPTPFRTSQTNRERCPASFERIAYGT
jgi:hypothetical protein